MNAFVEKVKRSLQRDSDLPLAERARKEAGADTGAQVKRVFALAFQRAPTAKELGAATKLATDHGLAALCRAVLNANEFVFVD